MPSLYYTLQIESCATAGYRNTMLESVETHSYAMIKYCL